MKIRQGHVSNSSTSSFLIYGVSIDSGELMELLGTDVVADVARQELEELEHSEYYDAPEGWREWDSSMQSQWYESHYGVSEALDCILKTPYWTYFGTVYLGASWSAVKDDETGAEFKDRVKREVLQAIPALKGRKFATHKEAWRDG